MEDLNSPILSSSTATSSALTGEIPIAIPGWDEPLTEEELDAIDAAVEATVGTASNHKKRRFPAAEDNRLETLRRRLPRSFSLSPCQGSPPRKAAVMQICCGTDHCYVMHIIHSGIPQSLKLLLEDSTVVKVGVGIFNDALKVQKDYNISVQACEDLSCLANEKLVNDQRNWSLASLTEILVSKQLPKPKNIRLGNWEALFLSREQLQYAATDAFTSWHLYQVLKSLPDLETNNCEIDNRGEAPTRVLP